MHRSLLLVFILPAVTANSYNFSEFTVSPHSILIEATIHIVSEFFALESNQIYIRRRANEERNVYPQRDIINGILLRLESQIAVQLETFQAKVLDQSRAHNVFLVDDYEAFGQISDGMKIRTYDYTGYFLIIVSDSSANSYQTVQKIMEDLWSHYIVNVIVLLAYDDAPGQAFFYTYFPYGQGYCEQARPLLWRVFEAGRFQSAYREFFPKKLLNFYGCPLKMATFSIPPFMILTYGADGKVSSIDGLDGIVARVLNEKINSTMEVVEVDPPDWGITAKLGHCTGVSRYIRDRVVNYSIGYWSTTYSRNRYMGNTVTYYTSLITTVVPPGYPYSSLEQLTLPFKYIIWSCVSCILAIALIVIFIVHHRKPMVQHFVFGRSITSPLLNTFNVFFGGSITRSPSRNFSRTLLAFWLFYSLIIRTSYTGALFNFLQRQPIKVVPMHIPDYIAAGYQIRMSRNYSYVFDAFPDIFPYLRQTSLRDFVATERYALQLPSTRFIHIVPIESVAFENRELTKRGEILRVSMDRVYLSSLTIYSQRSSPVLQPFNYILGQLNAAGLINQWASVYYQPVFLKERARAPEPRQLTIRQVTGCFELLAFGLAASGAVFAIEYVLRRRKLILQLKRIHDNKRKRISFVM